MDIVLRIYTIKYVRFYTCLFVHIHMHIGGPISIYIYPCVCIYIYIIVAPVRGGRDAHPRHAQGGGTGVGANIWATWCVLHVASPWRVQTGPRTPVDIVDQ